MSEVIAEAAQLTRDNFTEVGEWAGVTECWGLDAPSPALHLETPEGLVLAHLGDWIMREADGAFRCYTLAAKTG